MSATSYALAGGEEDHATPSVAKAGGDDPPSPKGKDDLAKAPIAKVVVAADDTEVAIVVAGIAEQLERLGVRVDTRRDIAIRPEEVVGVESGEANVVARAWLDFKAPSEAVLYVTDSAGSRVLVRRFPRAGRVEMAREATMAALQTAVDALLHGAALGVSREEARADLGLAAPSPAKDVALRQRSPASTPNPGRRRSSEEATIGLGVYYEVGDYAKNAIEHGPALRLSFAMPVRGRLFGISFTGQYRFPIEATAEPISVRIDSGALRLTTFAQLTRPSPIEVRALVGGGVDIVRADPDLVHSVDATLIPIGRVDPVFRAGVLARLPLRVLNRPAIELELALDVAPFVRAFDIARDTQTPLIAPWRVRPLALVGVALP